MDNRPILLLPVHQPGNELLPMLRELLADGTFRLLVADDGSDASYDPLFDALPPEVTLLRSSVHLGKGITIKAGLRAVMERFPDAIGVVTAEVHRGHSVENLCTMAEALYERDDAVLLGERVFDCALPKKSRLGNWLVRLAFSGACSIRITDTQTDLRAYPAAMLPALVEISGERYDYATNVLLRTVDAGIDIAEVPMPVHYTQGAIPRHYHPVRDSIRIFRRIFKFAVASFSGFCIDYVSVLALRSLTAASMDESLSLFISVLVGRLLSGITSFTINRHMGFHVQERMWRSALKYFTILFCIMAVNYWLLFLTHLIFHVPLWIAKIVVETGMFFVNYALQSRLVFNPKKKKLDAAASGNDSANF